MNDGSQEPAARDDVLRECQGFRSLSGSYFHHKLRALFAERLVWIVGGLAPYTAARFLHPCALQHAQYTLVKLLDGRQYLLKVHRLSVEQKSTWQSMVVCGNNAASTSGHLRGFRLFLKTYVYDTRTGTFELVPGMPGHLPHQICQAVKALQLIETAGGDWQMFNVAQKRRRRDMLHMYGNKKRLVPPRHFWDLTAPGRKDIQAIFNIQLLEEIYLIFRGRYLYPILIMIFTIPALRGMTAMFDQQRKKVMALMNECRLTPMVQERWVRATSSHRLVPGDVIVLHSGRALCDMVLLRGACLVTEAMLSGEAEQLRKSAYVPEDDKIYDPDTQRSCTIYAGTMVQQVWNPANSEDEVLVMVCRTGLNTAMGSIIGELLVPTKTALKDPVVADIMLLYLFAMVLQCLILIPYMIKAPKYGQTAKQVIWRLLDLVISAVPPGLPLVLLLVGAVSQNRLLKDGLLLLFPDTIRHGADVDVVCFDKTGTLTNSTAHLHGVLPVNKAAFGPLQQNALRWSNKLKQMFAVCHSLNMVSRSAVAGANLEVELFKAVEASFLNRETILLPHRPDIRLSSSMVKLSIVKVLEFSSQTLRSGAVVLSEDAPPGSALLFLRGAPAVIRSLVNPATVPHDFDQVMDEYSSKSFRLLAGAVGIIRDADQLDLARMTQQQVEACATNMQLLSLVVLTNSVRKDSRQTIHQMQDGGGIRTLMITGDYHHTALAVAKDVGMLKPQDSVVVIDVAAIPQQPLDPSLLLTPRTVSKALSPPAQARSHVTHHTTAAQQASGLGQSQGQVAQPAAAISVPAMKSKRVKWDSALGTKKDLGDGDTLASQLSTQEMSERKSSPLQTAQDTVSPTVPAKLSAQVKHKCSPLQIPSDNSADPSSVLAPPPQGADQGPSMLTPSGRPPRLPLEGLAFQPAAGVGTLGASEALAALAEGQMQCAVTGDAFGHLLQHHDLSVLEAVLRSAVVFSRMQPHQKGQVMDLLGSRGIHQMFDGQPRHIQGLGLTTMFCGDGINDLAALSAADVGMAIGADAVIAAELLSSKASIAGVASFIKVSKGAWAMLTALFKYMVVYECIKAEANMAAFFLDGSSISNMQMGAIDLQAMALALACCWVPPLKKMNRHKPPPFTCSSTGLILMASSALGLQVIHFWLALFLCTRPWFTGGNGTAHLNPVASSAWLAAYLQLLLPLVTLTLNTKGFCEPVWRTNGSRFYRKPVLVIAVTYVIMSFVADLVRPDQHLNLLSLYNFPQSFRWQFTGIAVAGIHAYAAWLAIIRIVLRQHQQRKIHP